MKPNRILLILFSAWFSILMLTIAAYRCTAQSAKYRLVVNPIDSGFYKVHFTKAKAHNLCDHKIYGVIFWTGKDWRWETNEMKDKGFNVCCVDYRGRRLVYMLVEKSTGKISHRTKAKSMTYAQCADEFIKRGLHSITENGPAQFKPIAVASGNVCKHCGEQLFRQPQGTWVHSTFEDGGFINCQDHKDKKANRKNWSKYPTAEPITSPHSAR